MTFTSTAWVAALTGMTFGLSLIVAIGAQNAFVLRQGLRGEHLGPVVALCAASDAVLIALSVAGVSAAVGRAPTAVTVIRFAGAAFLLTYAVLAARRALRPHALLPAEKAAAPAGLAATLATCALLTWLNPHVYLDTMLIGSLASTHAQDRWWFAAGTALASLAWFSALGYGATLLRPVFARPAAWRALDGVIALTMTALAVLLVVHA